MEQVLAKLPPTWVEENAGFRSIARKTRIQNAPASAPGHSQYDPKRGRIVVFDKGMYHRGKIDHEQLQRSLLHEICHSFLRDRPKLLGRWGRETKGDGFVDEYAKTSPAEDICDTFSEYFLHHDKVKEVAPKKSAFIKSLLETTGQEKTAMYLISAFSDELNKTASPAVMNILKRISSGAKGPAGEQTTLLESGSDARYAFSGHLIFQRAESVLAELFWVTRRGKRRATARARTI